MGKEGGELHKDLHLAASGLPRHQVRSSPPTWLEHPERFLHPAPGSGAARHRLKPGAGAQLIKPAPN